ncbi:DegT/DnrJ/EryC1/StrS family aminotransferase [Acanthopleuribacter pedis]|uniref:DegT/DnrJ/EryC1/StrS family aminotransferase n=1 Tax=Acanthopleuribacter pedis TaxID=442870 RepID=A0A8J7QCF2_9BACT|nr:DegT/DnrJ/EryC1/StrS family aminotransferase [Acanthopleuribacter pedis]MBO1316985.1 DegT/DnrJ/EryC1/StrS family aminotransferase [Acanthopleuribacter pedis]
MSQGIPFVDLRTQYQQLESQIRERIDAVLDHGRYINGPEVDELEAKLAEFSGAEHVVACSSGTDALLIPLMAWGIQPGDAVFTTPFTFIATAEVIALLGATPVFVDIDPDTFNMDPVALEQAIQRVKTEGELKPKAVIPVDLFGLCADYTRIEPIAKAHDLQVLEDAAQALGARHGDRAAGAFGHAAATSFYPAKPLGGYGDGGAVFTNDAELKTLFKSIREHGMGHHRYENVRVGINGRLDSLQAAILLVKLAAFPAELEGRNRVAAWYGQKLKTVKTPVVPDGTYCSWAQYSVLSEQRDDLMAKLKAENIPSVIYYPRCLHLQPAFDHYGYKEGDFPVSEEASRKIFSLPMTPFLTEDQVDRVAEVLNNA